MCEEEESYLPSREVWSLLYSGLDQADAEMQRLPKRYRADLAATGRIVHMARSQFRVPPNVVEFFESVVGETEDEWVRFFIDYNFAKEAVERGAEGVERFHEVVPPARSVTLSERSQRYLEEAVGTYLFGFDGPCIAFCGAALEQVLKERLVEAGEVSEEQLRRDRLSGGELLEFALRTGLLQEREAASRLLHERNRVMHRHLWDRRILRQMALKSLEDLRAVLEGLEA